MPYRVSVAAAAAVSIARLHAANGFGLPARQSQVQLNGPSPVKPESTLPASTFVPANRLPVAIKAKPGVTTAHKNGIVMMGCGAPEETDPCLTEEQQREYDRAVARRDQLFSMLIDPGYSIEPDAFAFLMASLSRLRGVESTPDYYRGKKLSHGNGFAFTGDFFVAPGLPAGLSRASKLPPKTPLLGTIACALKAKGNSCSLKLISADGKPINILTSSSIASEKPWSDPLSNELPPADSFQEKAVTRKFSGTANPRKLSVRKALGADGKVTLQFNWYLYMMLDSLSKDKKENLFEALKYVRFNPNKHRIEVFFEADWQKRIKLGEVRLSGHIAPSGSLGMAHEFRDKTV